MSDTSWLAVATFFLALIALGGLFQQAIQFRKVERNAVLPFPVIEGLMFFPEAEIGGPIKPGDDVGLIQLQSIRVRNLGRGPALYLTWDLTPQTASGAPALWQRILRKEIRPIHVGEHETQELWHPTDRGPEKQLPMEGERIALWYEDTFGNHYSCTFQRQENQWVELSRNRLPASWWRRIFRGTD